MDTTPTTLSQDSSAVDEQHSVARTLVLHLLPGVLILVFFVAVAPLLWGLGFPPAMAAYLAIAFVVIPFELGYLIYQARKNGTSLGSIVLYRQPVPRGQFVLLVVALFVGGSLIGGLLIPVDFFVRQNLFSWLPQQYDVFYGLYAGVGQFSTGSMLIMWVFGLIVNVIVAPVVEEMYFRGYLLPRISRFGAWAPLLNTVLFSLSLLQPLWVCEPHRFVPTGSLWGVVEAQHLREHDCARSVQLRCLSIHITAHSRGPTRLAHLKQPSSTVGRVARLLRCPAHARDDSSARV